VAVTSDYEHVQSICRLLPTLYSSTTQSK